MLLYILKISILIEEEICLNKKNKLKKLVTTKTLEGMF